MGIDSHFTDAMLYIISKNSVLSRMFAEYVHNLGTDGESFSPIFRMRTLYFTSKDIVFGTII